MDRDSIKLVILSNLADSIYNVELADINVDKSMTDYGASSLDIVSIVSSSMRQLKIKVPRTELKHVKTIDGLINLFVESASL